MRLGPILASALVLGCVGLREPQSPAVTAALAPPEAVTAAAYAVASPADPKKTLDYWMKIREITERKSSKEPKTCLAECKRDVMEIRAIPAIGVDGELLACGENIARQCDRVAVLLESYIEYPRIGRYIAGFDRAIFDSTVQINDSVSCLRGLRAKLSTRYGTEFPAIKNPD
jgi:hypothetical protein